MSKRMKILCQSVSQADDVFQKKRNHRSLYQVSKFLIVVMVLCCLFLVYAIRYGYFDSGCGAVIGLIMDETYYFTNPHKGLYAYTPNGSLHRILKMPEYSSWLVGNDRIFYISDSHIYMIEDESKTMIFDLSQLKGRGYELRTIEHSKLTFTYFEGRSEKIVSFNYLTGDIIAIENYEFYPRNTAPYGQIVASTDDYTYYVKDRGDDSSNLYCYSNDDETSWMIYENIAVYSAATDGIWFYTCTPWNGGNTACWKIIYDREHKPSSLELIDKDITK